MLIASRFHGDANTDEVKKVEGGDWPPDFIALSSPRGETWGATEQVKVMVVAIRATNCEDHPFAGGCWIEKLAVRA